MSSPRRIVELDGLRGLAILLVLCVHFGSVIPAQSATEQFVNSLLSGGWCGVDLFFVLSGFLITGILIDTRQDSGCFRKFFVRRMLRIFPLYYGVLLAVFFIGPVWIPGLIDDHLRQSQASLWLYFSNLQTMVTGPESMRGHVVNFSHFWSLAIEEQFYLIWPFVVFRLSDKHLARLCTVLIATGIPIRLIASQVYGPFAPYYFTPCRLETLAAGALCACLIRSLSAVHIKKYAPRAFWAGMAGLALLYSARGGLRFNDPVVTIFGQTCLSVGFAGLLLLTCFSQGTRLGRLLSHSVLQALGKYSYGIYVFHGLLQVFLWSVKDLFLEFVPNYFLSVPLYVGCCGMVSFLLALVSWEYEKLFLNFKSYFDYDSATLPKGTNPQLPAEPAMVSN